MSLLTLPLILINLGGEMLYILEQRLSAQQIPAEKTERVLRDIIEQMLSDKFAKELFSPQAVYKKKGMKSVFERLAHTSIMKLNSSSMGKLYDLMIMAFKYQLLHCRHPRDILLVTLNHLDAMDTWCSGSKEHEQLTKSTKLKLFQTYGDLSTSEIHEVRLSLLTFLQDIHIRVSIFLRDHVQLSSGKFILLAEGEIVPPFEIPGVVKTFRKDRGDRSITYGVNMYATPRALITETPLTRPILVTQEQCTIIPPYKRKDSTNLAYIESGAESVVATEGEVAAKEELNALARLIGIRSNVNEDDTFRLILLDEIEGFDNGTIENTTAAKVRTDFDIRIEPKKKDETHLNEIMREFTLADDLTSDSCQDPQDILQLMDAIV